MMKLLGGGVAALLSASAAQAITADGVIGAGEYAGALTTVVTVGVGVDPNTQLPSNPGPFVENANYTVYFTSDATRVYVGLQSIGRSNLPFANLYFDTNNAVSMGSDVGLRTNNDAFVPATGTFSPFTLTSLGVVFQSNATGAAGDVIEFSIPWAVFTTNALGLGQPLVAPGGQLQLRTVQAFNYAAATGDGSDAGAIPRFGFVTAPGATAAVPEPATWGMMLLGFGLVGAATRSRRTTAFA